MANKRFFQVLDKGNIIGIFVENGTVTQISTPFTATISLNILLCEKDNPKFNDYERSLKYSLNLFFNQTPNEFIDFYKFLDKTSVAYQVASELISQKLPVLKELVDKLELLNTSP